MHIIHAAHFAFIALFYTWKSDLFLFYISTKRRFQLRLSLHEARSFGQFMCFQRFCPDLLKIAQKIFRRYLGQNRRNFRPALSGAPGFALPAYHA